MNTDEDPSFPSVGSLPLDCDIDADSLVSYLTFDAGLQSAGSFLGGDLDALVAQPLAFEQPAPGLGAKAEPPTTSSPMGPCDLDDSQNEHDNTASGKRRRRIRNSKQQELNRLAQQRYRQRKKEKYSELQCTVGCLQSQMDRLSFLEKETTQLKQGQAQLQAQLAARDAALAVAQQQVRAVAVQLKAAQDKCVAQERAVQDQAAVIDQQRQQLKSSTLAGLDPQSLSDRLLAIVKTALEEASAQSGSAAAALTSEAVVQQISRTLTSCCRDLVYQGKQPLPAEAPKAIPVSCF